VVYLLLRSPVYPATLKCILMCVRDRQLWSVHPLLLSYLGSASERAKGICRQTERRRYTHCLTANIVRSLRNAIHAVLRDGVIVQLCFNVELFIAFIRQKCF
jgi:hypothetical protein